MITRDFIQRLKRPKRNGDGWLALCPAHNDHRPSLSVKYADNGGLLLHCFAGCPTERICDSLGIDRRQLASDQTHSTRSAFSRIAATYDYTDESGLLLFQVVRYEPKQFRQRQPDSKDNWIWNLTGVRRVPYNLPELLAADRSLTVFIVEGEKDADRLSALGLVASTNAGGAGKWRDEYNEVFRDRYVAILPDNDEPGRKHAQHVAESLVGVASSVKIVELPNTPEKGDVSAWLAAGNGMDRLSDIVSATNPFLLDQASGSHSVLTSYADFMAQMATDGEIIAFESCRGELVLLQSVTNKGKSTFIRNTAFCLTAGREFAPIVTSRKPQRVLLVNFEGSRGRFQSDLQVMERIFDDTEKNSILENFFPAHAPEIDDEPLTLSRHMKIFTAEARAIKPDVIIIDTASAAFNIRNESDNSEVAQLMKMLIRLARSLNCLGVIVHHIGKARAEDGQNREAAHRGRGASAWADFSSAIFNLESHQSSDLVTLTCGKRKTGTGENYETTLRLDRESRWFSVTGDAPPKPLSNREQVLRVLSESETLPTAGVEQLLEGQMSGRTVRTCLKQLVTEGLVTQPKRGRWKIREHHSRLGNSGNGHKNFPNFLIEESDDDVVN